MNSRQTYSVRLWPHLQAAIFVCGQMKIIKNVLPGQEPTLSYVSGQGAARYLQLNGAAFPKGRETLLVGNLNIPMLNGLFSCVPRCSATSGASRSLSLNLLWSLVRANATGQGLSQSLIFLSVGLATATATPRALAIEALFCQSDGWITQLPSQPKGVGARVCLYIAEFRFSLPPFNLAQWTYTVAIACWVG